MGQLHFPTGDRMSDARLENDVDDSGGDSGRSVVGQDSRLPAVASGPPVGFFDSASQAVHNFVGTPPEIYRLEMKATGADVGDKTTFPVEGIALRFVYFHKVPIANEESGEITDQIRSVVVDTDGHCWGFVSNGIWQSLLPLLKLYQFGEIKPPMKVRLERIRTANKFEMLRIVPV
jgi:hypothetical protein